MIIRGSTRRRLANVGLDLLAILVVGILIFPIIWLYLTALKPQSEIFGNPLDIVPHTVTFANFSKIWHAVGFAVALRNSLIVASASAVIVTLVGLAAAFSLSRFRYPLRSLFSVAILAVQMLPGIVIVVPLIVILRHLGLTDSLVGLTIAYLLIGLPIAVWMLRGISRRHSARSGRRRCLRWRFDGPGALADHHAADGAGHRRRRCVRLHSGLGANTSSPSL